MQEMCRVLGVSRSGYYKWHKHRPSKRKVEGAKLLNAIRSIHKEHCGRIGSPKMKEELNAQGILAGKNRVAKTMKENKIRAITHRKFRGVTTDSNHSLPVAANLLNREFTVSAPNKVLVSDITYIKTRSGWVYLTVFIDLFSRMVVGWAVSTSLSTAMVQKALTKAIFTRRLGAGVTVHSDRGVQYASDAFRSILKKHQFVQSMSRKGNCWDNAVAESFFRVYKTELAYHCDFRNKKDVYEKTFEYIECYYNRKRRHGTNGFLSPAEYEQRFRKAA